MTPQLPTIEQCADATVDSLRAVLPESALPLIHSAFQAGFRAALANFQVIGGMSPADGVARIQQYQDESELLLKQTLARFASQTH